MSINIIDRLNDEADQCRADGADDIAQLLDDAVAEVRRLRSDIEQQAQDSRRQAEIAAGAHELVRMRRDELEAEANGLHVNMAHILAALGVPMSGEYMGPAVEAVARLRAQAGRAPDLMPIIMWLERGGDPKEAALELRMYNAEHCAAPNITGQLLAAAPAAPEHAPAVHECLCATKCLGAAPISMCKGLPSALAQPAPAVAQQGPSGDPLTAFEDGQWWVRELDAAVDNGTDDQKRAMAVVRNLLETVKTVCAAPVAPAVAQPASDQWRTLALQFDRHRMAALWHLRALLQDPAGHAQQATEFLATQPALAAARADHVPGVGNMVPDGWSIEQRDGAVIVFSPKLGAYAARVGDESIASAVLAQFALDVLAAAPAAPEPAPSEPEPEPVARLRRYAGQTMRTARNPNLTAREAIAVGNWLAAQPAPAVAQPLKEGDAA